MVYFILYILAVVGLAKIIVESDMPLIVWARDPKEPKIDSETNKPIEEKTRFMSQGWGRRLLQRIPCPFETKWDKILDCYQCCGTWCGFVCGYILISHNPLIILLSGFAGSYIAQWGVIYLEYLQAQTLVSLKDD